MKKRYFYEFSGNVFLEVNDQTEAEKLVTGISLERYLIDEELFEIDEDYIAYDLKRREEQLGTYLHPVNDRDHASTGHFRPRTRWLPLRTRHHVCVGFPGLSCRPSRR